MCKSTVLDVQVVSSNEGGLWVVTEGVSLYVLMMDSLQNLLG